MKKYLLLLVLISATNFSFAQTFTGTGGGIPDNAPPVNFYITVSGLSPATLNYTHGLVQVCVNITHTYDADLVAKLIAPDGTSIALFSGVGGGGNNFTNTCFDTSATTSIGSGNAPFNGNFLAQGNLGNVNNGQNGNGVWTLQMQDVAANDIGSVLNWHITFGNNAPLPFNFSSNLPLVILNTHGQSVVDDPRIISDFSIINNALPLRNHLTDAPQFAGLVGIEYRGSSSQSFPKKGYGFSTLMPDSITNEDTLLLGYPAEHDWILYAPYTDKTFLRDVLTFRLGREMGHYATRTTFVELVVNGQYEGIYVLEEQVKRDKGRVDIAKMKLSDTTGVDATGGYILKIDKFTGTGGGGFASTISTYYSQAYNVYFQYSYPKDIYIQPNQEFYIQNFIANFEQSLAYHTLSDTVFGYRKYTDVPSFIDFFISNEVAKNIDGYRLSTYLHKEKDGVLVQKKLKMGPLWDFNLTYGNADYCNGAFHDSLEIQDPCDPAGVPWWWKRLLQDPWYANQMKCRWTDLRLTTLATPKVMLQIDSMVTWLAEAEHRDSTRWQTLGNYVWPNAYVPATYHQEIDTLKHWIAARLNWLDAHFPGIASGCHLQPTTNTADLVLLNQKAVTIYPNPATDNCMLMWDMKSQTGFQITIYNMLGQTEYTTQQVSENAFGRNQTPLDISNLRAGVYMVEIKGDGQKVLSRLVKE